MSLTIYPRRSLRPYSALRPSFIGFARGQPRLLIGAFLNLPTRQGTLRSTRRALRGRFVSRSGVQQGQKEQSNNC